jgi:hypothetical protein
VDCGLAGTDSITLLHAGSTTLSSWSPSFSRATTSYAVETISWVADATINVAVTGTVTVTIDGSEAAQANGFATQSITAGARPGGNATHTVNIATATAQCTYTLNLSAKQPVQVQAAPVVLAERFGTTLAMARDVPVLVVGNPRFGDNTVQLRGRIQTYRRSGNVWVLEASVVGDVALDELGTSVAVNADGTRIAFGAPGEDEPMALADGGVAANSGAVYLYTRDPLTGTLSNRVRVKASNFGVDDRFGAAVALDSAGSTLAVGAPAEDSASSDPVNNAAAQAGAVYVFDGVTGAQQAYLKAPSSGTGAVTASMQLGSSVAIDPQGQTIVAGAPFFDAARGAVYTWSRQTGGASWGAAETLPFPSGSARRANDGLGTAVAIDGNRVIASAPYFDGGPTAAVTDTGYVANYVKGTSWSASTFGLIVLGTTNSEANNRYGESLSFRAPYLVVGVPGDRGSRLGLEGWFGTFSSPQFNSGAARVYLLEAGAWVRQSVLKIAPWPMNYNVPPLNRYGSSVTIGAGGQHVAVGAPYDLSPTGGVHLTPPNVTSAAFEAGAAFIW